MEKKLDESLTFFKIEKGSVGRMSYVSAKSTKTKHLRNGKVFRN